MQCTVHEAEAAHCMQQVEATADLNCRLEAELAQLQHAVVCPRVQGCLDLDGSDGAGRGRQGQGDPAAVRQVLFTVGVVTAYICMILL